MRVLLRLSGGLGNQLFQLSRALDLCEDAKRVRVSAKHIKKYETVHDFVTDQLIDLSAFGQANAIEDAVLSLRLPKLVQGNLFRICLLSDNNSENSFKGGDLNILDGYFQNGDINRLKNIKKHISRNIVEKNLLVIHLRGGDFFKLGHTTREIDKFYERAIGAAFEHGANEDAVVVTDDVELTESLKSLKNYKISKGKTLDDFDEIRGARFKIYNNSTFAISAAALGSENSLCFTSGMDISGKKRTSFLKNEVIINE